MESKTMKEFTFPGVFQKYTKTGKKACKNKVPVTQVFESSEQFQKYMDSHPEEDWRFDHKK